VIIYRKYTGGRQNDFNVGGLGDDEAETMRQYVALMRAVAPHVPGLVLPQ
jgi:hypothetical protein